MNRGLEHVPSARMWKWGNTPRYRWHSTEIFPSIIRWHAFPGTRARVMPRGRRLDFAMNSTAPESRACRRSVLPRVTRIMRRHCVAGKRELLTHCSSRKPALGISTRAGRRSGISDGIARSVARDTSLAKRQRIDYRMRRWWRAIRRLDRVKKARNEFHPNSAHVNFHRRAVPANLVFPDADFQARFSRRVSDPRTNFVSIQIFRSAERASVCIRGARDDAFSILTTQFLPEHYGSCIQIRNTRSDSSLVYLRRTCRPPND